jgi:hypothetical protein
VAGVSTSNTKSKELDGPLAGRASAVGGAVPTAGAATAESVVGAAGRSPTRAAGPVARAMSVLVFVE